MVKVTKDTRKRANELLDSVLESLDLEITEDNNSLFCLTHKDRKNHRLSVKTKLAIWLYLITRQSREGA